MNPIDVDPEVLRVTAEASGHAFDEAINHIGAEIKATDGNYEPLMNTLTPEGPYAYTILPEVRPDGSVKLPILTTREQIADAYAMIRGFSDLVEVIGLTEIRGTWYTFQDNISKGRNRESGKYSMHQTLGIFPSGRGAGITGELIWVYVPRSSLGTPGEPSALPDDPLLARQYVYEQYVRYMDALKANDVDAVLDVLSDKVASAVRDYAYDTGTVTALEGVDAHRSHYQAFFDRYDVQSIQPLSIVTDTWYQFAELRTTVVPRSGGGPLAYNTAEFFIPANDGRFIARIGHGTQPT